jgi:predicted nicotinamide N-methyase
MIATINGAEKVVITDWPEPQLMNRIKRNVEVNTPEQYVNGVVKVVVCFFIFHLDIIAMINSKGEIALKPCWYLLYTFVGLPMGPRH